MDFVSLEAEELADGVARYLPAEGLPDQPLLVRGDGMVAQLIPGRISGKEDVTLSFRVRRPVRGCTIELRQGDKVIKTIKKPKALPAEMLRIPVAAGLLDGQEDLEVRVLC